MTWKRKNPGALAGAAEAKDSFHTANIDGGCRYGKPVHISVAVCDLLDKIERSWLLNEPLRMDGLDLLQLHDDYLSLWLSDVPSIIVGDVLLGQAIRNRLKAEACPNPPRIFVSEARHGT